MGVAPRAEEQQAAHGEPTVFIIDDDPDVRRSVALLVQSVDLRAEQFASPRDFLAAYDPERVGCLVLDMRMPGMSGLELQNDLVVRGTPPPIIFISAHGEIPNATAAMRAGAVDFIGKPYSPQLLLERIHEALTLDRRQREERRQRIEITERMAKLTDREQEVMHLLVRGDSTKVIAARLNISTKTVDNHRAKILEKMGVDNCTQLCLVVKSLE